MKTASPELIAHLGSSTQFQMCDCYEFTLLDGTKIRSTSWDRDVVLGGQNLVIDSIGLATSWAFVGVKSPAIGPDGVMGSAFRYAYTSTAYPQMNQNSHPVVAGLPYALSVWIKQDQAGIGAGPGLLSNAGNLACQQTLASTGGWQKLFCMGVASATGNANIVIMGDSTGVPVTGGYTVAFPKFCQGSKEGIYVPTAGVALDTRVTFPASGLKIKRDRTRCVVGLEVDTISLTIMPSATDLVGSLSFLRALNNGALDGATFTLQRVFMADPLTPVGSVVLFTGSVSEAEFSRTEARVKIKSELERLNMQVPRNLFTPSCRWTFGDVGCTFNRTSVAVNASISSGATTNRTFVVSALTQPAGYFDQGVILFTSGNLAGIKRTVLKYTPGSITLGLALPRNPAYGDGFTIYPGCDKTMAKCSSYGNLLNFGGQPFIPVPETAR